MNTKKYLREKPNEEKTIVRINSHYKEHQTDYKRFTS